MKGNRQGRIEDIFKRIQENGVGAGNMAVLNMPT